VELQIQLMQLSLRSPIYSHGWRVLSLIAKQRIDYAPTDRSTN
jgi:hypothetical protein